MTFLNVIKMNQRNSNVKMLNSRSVIHELPHTACCITQDTGSNTERCVFIQYLQARSFSLLQGAHISGECYQHKGVNSLLACMLRKQTTNFWSYHFIDQKSITPDISMLAIDISHNSCWPILDSISTVVQSAQTIVSMQGFRNPNLIAVFYLPLFWNIELLSRCVQYGGKTEAR